MVRNAVTKVCTLHITDMVMMIRFAAVLLCDKS